MTKVSSATTRPTEMKIISTEDRGSSQYSDAQKRVLRRASMSRAAGRYLPDEEEAGVPELGEETHTHLIRRLHQAKRMVPVSLRIDSDVLEWLKKKGDGHLERINDMLTGLMEAERRARR